jgi:hypothetical protein
LLPSPGLLRIAKSRHALDDALTRLHASIDIFQIVEAG